MCQELQAIADRILSLITEKDISYGELSKATGIPKSALQRYATGETLKIPLDRVQKIAKVVGVSPAWIMGWENEPLSIAQKVGKLTQHEEKVILAYRDKPAIQPAVDKLLDVEKPEILKAAARNGRHLSSEEIEKIKTLITEERSGNVPPEVIDELINKADTLPDFVD